MTQEKQELTEERVRGIVREEIEKAFALRASLLLTMEMGEREARRLLGAAYQSPKQ